VSKTVINENQDFITGWFREAFIRGEMEEEAPLEPIESMSPRTPSLLSGSTQVTSGASIKSPSTTAVGSSAASMQFANPFEKYFDSVQSPVSRSTTTTTSTSRRSSSGPSRRKSRLGSLMFKMLGSDQDLLNAASDGDAKKVAELIRKGANVNVKDRWGWAPMSMAAYGGYPDIAKILIEANADLDYQDVDGDTPLDLATNKGKSLPGPLTAPALSHSPCRPYSCRSHSARGNDEEDGGEWIDLGPTGCRGRAMRREGEDLDNLPGILARWLLYKVCMTWCS
jgi:hypothetical protein